MLLSPYIAHFILLVSLHIISTFSFILCDKRQHAATRATKLFFGGTTTSLRSIFMQLDAQGKDEQSDEKNKEISPVAKASWFAVEAFGNVFGRNEMNENNGDNDNTLFSSETMSYSLSDPPRSLEETLQRIQDDNDRSYFLSGEVDKLIYDEKCVFSDPFVSFKGRDRFVDNLANLGSFITKYNARMLNYEVQNNLVTTRVMVKLQLNLPWKPVLAWPWGVLYKIDTDTNLIVTHEESWDIEPLEGVKQIFRPATVEIKDYK